MLYMLGRIDQPFHQNEKMIGSVVPFLMLERKSIKVVQSGSYGLLLFGLKMLIDIVHQIKKRVLVVIARSGSIWLT